MDFPGATHPNIPVRALVSLIETLADKAMPSSKVCRVKTTATDSSKSMSEEIEDMDCSDLLASVLKSVEVVCESELGNVASTATGFDVLLFLFEDLVAPWSTPVLESLVKASIKQQIECEGVILGIKTRR